MRSIGAQLNLVDIRCLETKTTGAAPEVGGAEREHQRIWIEEAIAASFQIDPEVLRQPTRGRAQVALARQVAMYLAHIICTLSLTEVGEMFDRDRTTVAHACAVIEGRRDDPDFDRAMELLEEVVEGLVRKDMRARGHMAGPKIGELPATHGHPYRNSNRK